MPTLTGLGLRFGDEPLDSSMKVSCLTGFPTLGGHAWPVGPGAPWLARGREEREPVRDVVLVRRQDWLRHFVQRNPKGFEPLTR